MLDLIVAAPFGETHRQLGEYADHLLATARSIPRTWLRENRGFGTQITEERSNVIVAKESCFLYTASALTLAHPAVSVLQQPRGKSTL